MKMCALVGRASSICVTSDSCTASNQEHVISYTATVLLGSELKTFCIGLKSFKGMPASWNNIQKVWESISTRISEHNPYMIMVSDQGSNFVCASNRQNIRRTDFDDAIRCVCHKLHLAVVGNLRRFASNPTAAENLVDRVRTVVAEVSIIALPFFLSLTTLLDPELQRQSKKAGTCVHHLQAEGTKGLEISEGAERGVPGTTSRPPSQNSRTKGQSLAL